MRISIPIVYNIILYKYILLYLPGYLYNLQILNKNKKFQLSTNVLLYKKKEIVRK